MRDFFMGAEVEVEELQLGAPIPDRTPPHGVVLSQLESDGWIRRYNYKASYDLHGKKSVSKLLVGEIPPEPGVEVSSSMGSSDREVRLSKPLRVNVPGMDSPLGQPIQIQMAGRIGAPTAPVPADNRLNLPSASAIPLRQGPFLSQAAQAPQQTQDVSVPMISDPMIEAPEAAAPPEPEAEVTGLPDCERPMQLPDGKVIEPDDELTLRDFCAMLPFILKLTEKEVAQDQGFVPNGRIPLNRIGSVPSFGPAGSPFAQGGGGGGGGGGTPGPGPIGVVTGNTPIGGPGQGTQGPPGPAGPQGPAGAANIAGIQKTDGDFSNIGAMAIVPGTSFDITVGGDGKVAISFSLPLSADGLDAEIFDVFAGIQIGSTQYRVWRESANNGGGGDRFFFLTASGTLYVTLAPGTYTVSICYGDNPGLNHFTVTTTPSAPASAVAQYS